MVWLFTLQACSWVAGPEPTPEPISEPASPGPSEPIAEPASPEPSTTTQALTLQPGAVGVVRSHEGALQVLFPAQSVQGLEGLRPADGSDVSTPEPHHPIQVSGPLVLFDANGELARVDPGPFAVQFACENDAGIAYAAVATLTDVTMARPSAPGPDGIVSFVQVGDAAPVRPFVEAFDWPDGHEVLAEGDLQADGSVDAQLLTWPDEAICEEGFLTLATLAGPAPLRCCGP